MTDTETITENTTSHLYTRRGWELENISSRVVGIVWVNYRKRWGWSGWKSRWIELHKDYLLFSSEPSNLSVDDRAAVVALAAAPPF